jgi:hypothetical protein
MDERTFETILAKYPELIENGLEIKGRQVSMYGRRMDLLFEDSFQRKLLIELKVGPIKDQHIGQVMSYEGMLLSADDPTIRVMLIGNRVPPNLRRSLDHHGIAWKEISVSVLLAHLKDRNDSEMLGLFSQEELEFAEPTGRKGVASRLNEAATSGSVKGIKPISPDLLLNGYSASLTNEEVRQLFGEKYIEDAVQKQIYMKSARTFKLWANYIAALLIDREAQARGEAERLFAAGDIKTKLKGLMPYHYDKKGAKESSLLTADVKISAKPEYHLGFPCLEHVAGTGRYRFVGFKA